LYSVIRYAECEVLDVCSVAPPSYISSVDNAAISGPHQQPSAPQMGVPQMGAEPAYYSAAATGVTPPSVYTTSDAIPPVKI